MIAYASRTGTRDHLAKLRAAGYRLLVSAAAVQRHEGFQYALDNGAFTYFKKGLPFDEARYVKMLRTLGREADWVAVPDIVAGDFESLDLSVSWLERTLEMAPRALIPVQDGVTPDDVHHFLGPRVGIFIGGDPATNWKEETAPMWGRLGRERGCWVHMGRVNSARRISICQGAGLQSFDGSGVSQFPDRMIPQLRQAIQQLGLPHE
jgi:hypothetical protein